VAIYRDMLILSCKKRVLDNLSFAMCYDELRAVKWVACYFWTIVNRRTLCTDPRVCTHAVSCVQKPWGWADTTRTNCS